jgi:hypothetical protein
VLGCNAEGAFGGFREIEDCAFLGVELLENFFTKNYAEEVADFENVRLGSHGITSVTTWCVNLAPLGSLRGNPFAKDCQCGAGIL